MLGGLGDGAVDDVEVDALGHDRVPLGVRGDVDADELAHVALELGPGEQHGVRRVRGELLHEPARNQKCSSSSTSPKFERVSAAGQVERLDDGVRVGRDREHDGDVELARHVGGREAAHVGHAQVQHVDTARWRAAAAGCRGGPRPAAATRSPTRRAR